MYAPGIVGIAVGLLILLIMKDSPESVGYPPIEPKKSHARKSLSAPAVLQSTFVHFRHQPWHVDVAKTGRGNADLRAVTFATWRFASRSPCGVLKVSTAISHVVKIGP